MIFAALAEAAEKGELLIVEGGMCRFHKRKDGVVVIREILVLPEYRRRKIGRLMISDIGNIHRESSFLAKCPVGFDSNRFWESLGWSLIKTEKGLNTWMSRSSSGAPTATSSTPVSPSPPVGVTG